MKTKKLVLASIFIAIASVLSMITLFKMPYGGSVTPFSMLFIVLVGFYCGKIGIIAGLVYGFIQAILGPYFYTPVQVILDYGFAFMGLGVGAFIFTNDEDDFQLHKQYVAGVLCRFLFCVISGVVFFAQYAPEGKNAVVYSVTYNGLYLLTECIITLVVLCIPQVMIIIIKLKKENFL